MFKNAVNFEYEDLGRVIKIIDNSASVNGRTVTNGVEEVVKKLQVDGVDLTGKRIIYCDTARIWDEIVVKAGKDGVFRFHSFKPLTVKSFWDALEKVGGSGETRHVTY